MNEHRLKTSTVVAAFAVPIVLILLGAGCFQSVAQFVTKAGDDAANAVLAPTITSLDALQKAKEVALIEKARQNEKNDMALDDITVPFVLTEGATPPADAKVDAETFGCNDKIAMVMEHKAAATDSILHDALLTLFGLHDSGTHTPLYNSLASSKLQVEKIQSTDGVTTEVWLKGDIEPGGACDGPRIKAQLEATVKRYRPHYKMFLNGSEATYRCVGDMTGQCK